MTVFKILFFLLVVLPVTVFVFGFIIIPLVIILLICSLFWSGKVFHFGTFRKSDGTAGQEGKYWQEKADPEKGEYVDVESTVVESSVVEKEEKNSEEKVPPTLPYDGKK